MTSATIQASLTASATIEVDSTASATIVKTDGVHDIAVVAGGGLISSATFTNADERTYFDSDGLMQTVSANEARTTYIDGIPLLWIDGSVEEAGGYSNDLDNAAWNQSASAAKDAVGLDGGSNTGWTLTDSDNGVLQERRLTTTIADDTEDRFAVFAVKHDPSPSVYPVVGLRMSGGTAIEQRVLIDPSAGTLTEIGGESEGEVVLNPIRFGDYWLSVIKIANNGAGNTSALYRIFPAYNSDGSETLDASATGSTVFGYAGLFETDFSLMPVLTTGGTTKAVAADVASLTNSIISALTEGVIYMEIWSPQLTSDAARHIAELESDANNFIRAFIAADGDIDGQVTESGTSQAALAGPAHTVGTLHKTALVFGPSGFALYVDGTQEATGTGTVPSVDTLLIGAGLHGGIKTMNVHTDEWSQAKGESETT